MPADEPQFAGFMRLPAEAKDAVGMPHVLAGRIVGLRPASGDRWQLCVPADGFVLCTIPEPDLALLLYHHGAKVA